MNTKLIKQTTINSPVNLPKLSVEKMNRVVTKHFTNLAMYLDRDELAFINWLVYQSYTDNTFIYNSKLLRMYRQTIIEINKEYNSKRKVKISLTYIRYCLKNLIEKGYIIPVEGKFMINKSLTFHKKTKKDA